MRPINASDLEELLHDEGYLVDPDSGAVYDDGETSLKFLITCEFGHFRMRYLIMIPNFISPLKKSSFRLSNFLF